MLWLTHTKRIGQPEKKSNQISRMMRCAEITGAGMPLKITTRPVPTAPPGGALIKTTHGGICQSDLHLINNHLDLGGGNIMHYSSFCDGYIGGVPGHEVAGVIQEFGKDVNPKDIGFSVGDKVAVYPCIGCLKCPPCKAGFNNLCDDNQGSTTDVGRCRIPGGFGTHVPVPGIRFLAKIPDSVTPDVACMVPCSASTAYEALSSVKPQIEFAHLVRPDVPARLLVVGAGGLGLWCVRLARLGIPNVPLYVIVADIDQEKLPLAREAGADSGIVWNRDASVADCVQIATFDGKFDGAIDFVGSPKTAEICVASVNKGGGVALVGLAGGELKISIPKAIAGSLSIKGQRMASAQTLSQLLALLAKSNINFEHIEHVNLDDINDVLDRMRAGKVRGRAVICYD